jgi:type III secretion protein V
MKPVSITIRIELAVGQQWVERIERRSREELKILLEDLGLPAGATIEVVAEDPPRDEHSQESVRLFVDGLRIFGPRESSPEASVLATLHVNREELVTPGLANALWEHWTASETECPPEFTRLLRRLVAHRLRVDRVANAAKAWNESDPLKAFEEALSQTSRRIRMLVNPELVEEYDIRHASGEQTADQAPLPMMTDGLFYELGIHIGHCELVGVPELPPDELRIAINDLRGPPCRGLAKDEVLVNDTVQRLGLLNIAGRATHNPANDNECAIVASDYAGIAEHAGLTTWDRLGYVILVASTHVRANAEALLSLDALEFHLGQLDKAWPELVELARQRLGERRIADVLRLLLKENIGVRNLRFILEALMVVPPPLNVDSGRYIVFGSPVLVPLTRSATVSHPDTAELVELVRMALRQQISHQYTRGRNTLVVYLMAPEFEKLLWESETLATDASTTLMSAVRKELMTLPPTAQIPVILTTTEVRAKLRRQVEREFPHLSVVAYQELSPDINIQPIARIFPDEVHAASPAV